MPKHGTHIRQSAARTAEVADVETTGVVDVAT
jgi:hypothetical protein